MRVQRVQDDIEEGFLEAERFRRVVVLEPLPKMTPGDVGREGRDGLRA
ncbi:MAG: hypothetical protein ABL998_01880 [Planctomycetota bacterium]